MTLTALSKAGGSAPEQGIWGFKSKVIVADHGLNITHLTDPSETYTHQSYPLGFPLQLSWCHLMMGGFDEHLIKLLPIIFSGMLYILFFQICRKNVVGLNLSLLLPLVLCGGRTFFHTCTTLYAEPLLILYVISGLYLCYQYIKEHDYKYLFPGLCLLGGSAWIKNEGIVIYLLACLLISIFCIKQLLKDKQDLFIFVICITLPALIFILPWQIFRYYYNIRLNDFSMIHPFLIGFTNNWDVLKTSCFTAFKNLFVNISDNCGIWYLVAFLTLFNIKRIFRNREVLFLLLFFLGMLFVLVCIFLFSIRPLDWHMRAMQRTFLLPLSISWMFLILLIHSPKRGN